MIAIVGGGITGLALAWQLRQKNIPFRLFEASSMPGGNIQTRIIGAYQLELGPNSLRLTDNLHGWIEKLDLLGEMIKAHPNAKNRYILKQGRYQKLPSGPLSLMTSSTFSWQTKRKIMGEPKVKGTGTEHESVDAFFRRRLGDEIADYAVAPFVSGIYAGNSKDLLIELAFPELKAWENKYGSILKGFRKGRKPQKHKGIVSFKKGLKTLVKALYEPIESNVLLETTITHIDQADGRYRLHTIEDNFIADQIVLTLPTYQIAALLKSLLYDLSSNFDRVSYPPVSLVHTAYNKDQISHPLDGFGALHPPKEGAFTLGTIFSSTVFPDVCPENEVLLTNFVGGSMKSESARFSDNEILNRVEQDHAQFLGLKGKARMQNIHPWPQAIPQYDRGLLGLDEKAAELAKRGIFLGGNWRGGVSVGACLDQADRLTSEILSSSQMV